MSNGEPTLDELLNFALDAAWQAGRVTLGYFQTGTQVERKADNTPVTIADREAEQTLRRLITERWPGHALIGEEYGRAAGNAGDSGYTWIIDPIDGTKSFVQGVPFYAVLLALVKDDQPLLGVMYFPALNEIVYAARGRGCYWNGRPAHVSTVADLKDAVLLASDLDTFARFGREHSFQRLIDATYIQRTWGDAYGYALIATGRAEVMVDPVMEVWDCGPLQVILEEAGGTFTDWKGTPTIFNREAVATNGVLFDRVMAIIREGEA
ncbi:MAG TPA: histidinol-phosphatase [Promineifilum sp.]|nr:histidinol-phosphatase [Promineifilum sp.]HRO23721.1 histidinol-phosphatase [Promineifilum sp.]HRO91488.1 histidinol-phosphatase [Promineifilum sp.]HRQ12439.1 histidinol-phosphatase [Promineifilum sp.]